MLVSSCFEETQITPLLFESTLLSITEVALRIAFPVTFVTIMPVFIVAFFTTIELVIILQSSSFPSPFSAAPLLICSTIPPALQSFLLLALSSKPRDESFTIIKLESFITSIVFRLIFSKTGCVYLLIPFLVCLVIITRSLTPP